MQYNLSNFNIDYNNLALKLNFSYNKNDCFNNQNDLSDNNSIITFDKSNISCHNNLDNSFESFEFSKRLSESIEDNNLFNRIYFNDNQNNFYSNDSNNNENINMHINLQSLTAKKRKIHNGGDIDNILRKIQVHFLTFLVNFSNDVINAVIKADNEEDVPKFRELDYKIKKDIKYNNLELLKRKTIGDILKLNVTSKYKTKDININKYSYNKICAMCPSIKKYFNKNYLEIFKEYYYIDNKNFVEIDRNIITLSGNFKTFIDLIHKHIKYKDRLESCAINYFLDSHKKFKKSKFKIENFNNSN